MKRKSAVKIILEKLAEGIVTWMETFQWPYWKRYNYKPEAISRAIYRLKKAKWIKTEEKEDKIFIKITEKGKQRIVKYKLEELKIKRPKKWDRKWRIVIFDIPEKRKLARNVLREKLRELGFLKIQKSVFIHPYDCQNEIDFIKEVYKISPYVQFILAETIDQEEKYLKQFSLRQI